MTASDFASITEDGDLCDERGQLGPTEFENVMRKQIRHVAQSKLSLECVDRSPEELEFVQYGIQKMIFMELTRVESDLTAIKTGLMRITSPSPSHLCGFQEAAEHDCDHVSVCGSIAPALDGASCESFVLHQMPHERHGRRRSSLTGRLGATLGSSSTIKEAKPAAISAGSLRAEHVAGCEKDKPKDIQRFQHLDTPTNSVKETVAEIEGIPDDIVERAVAGVLTAISHTLRNVLRSELSNILFSQQNRTDRHDVNLKDGLATDKVNQNSTSNFENISLVTSSAFQAGFDSSEFQEKLPLSFKSQNEKAQAEHLVCFSRQSPRAKCSIDEKQKLHPSGFQFKLLSSRLEAHSPAPACQSDANGISSGELEHTGAKLAAHAISFLAKQDLMENHARHHSEQECNHICCPLVLSSVKECNELVLSSVKECNELNSVNGPNAVLTHLLFGPGAQAEDLQNPCSNCEKKTAISVQISAYPSACCNCKGVDHARSDSKNQVNGTVIRTDHCGTMDCAPGHSFTDHDEENVVESNEIYAKIFRIYSENHALTDAETVQDYLPPELSNVLPWPCLSYLHEEVEG